MKHQPDHVEHHLGIRPDLISALVHRDLSLVVVHEGHLGGVEESVMLLLALAVFLSNPTEPLLQSPAVPLVVEGCAESTSRQRLQFVGSLTHREGLELDAGSELRGRVIVATLCLECLVLTARRTLVDLVLLGLEVPPGP